MDIDDEDDFFAAGPSTPRGPGGAADPLVANEYARLSERYSDVRPVCPKFTHSLWPLLKGRGRE